MFNIGHGLEVQCFDNFYRASKWSGTHAEQDQVFHQLHLSCKFLACVWFSQIWSHVTILAELNYQYLSPIQNL